MAPFDFAQGRLLKPWPTQTRLRNQHRLLATGDWVLGTLGTGRWILATDPLQCNAPASQRTCPFVSCPPRSPARSITSVIVHRVTFPLSLIGNTVLPRGACYRQRHPNRCRSQRVRSLVPPQPQYFDQVHPAVWNEAQAHRGPVPDTLERTPASAAH